MFTVAVMLFPSPSTSVPLNLIPSNTVTLVSLTFKVIVASCLSGMISVNSVGLSVLNDSNVIPVLLR